MKIFNETNHFARRINFMDNNGVFVGYDFESCCCERFGYFFSNQIEKNADIDKDYLKESDINFENYIFDTEFFEDIFTEDDTNLVVFKLINEKDYSKPELYLHLYNHHNGYYSHGFSMMKCDKTIKEGSI